MNRPLAIAGIASTLSMLACQSDPPPAPATSSAPTATSVTTASSAGPVTTPAAPSTTAPPTTAAPTPTGPTFVPSPEPALAEWATSRVVTVQGSSKNACDTRMVREWLRVQCVNKSAERGLPVSITVLSGRDGEHYQGENLKAVNEITTLLVQARPGVEVEATFTWEKGTDTLHVAWPEGTPESSRVMAFSGSETGDGAPAVAAPAIVPPVATTPVAPITIAEPPLGDVATLAAPPTDEAWQKAPEARVMGSTSAGCETKIVGDWFRARCAGDAYKAIIPIRGHRKTQSKVEITAAGATLTTPYVEETELHARFEGASPRVLVLRWPKGPRPSSLGAFETPK